MNTNEITTRNNRDLVTVKWTDKAADFEKINIKGVRWFDGHNTQHKAYISGLNSAGVWVDIGETGIRSGYDNHYLVTAGAWLVANGYIIESAKTDGYFMGCWPMHDALGVVHYSQDVKRKKDM